MASKLNKPDKYVCDDCGFTCRLSQSLIQHKFHCPSIEVCHKPNKGKA